jgi:hypothetical protein
VAEQDLKKVEKGLEKPGALRHEIVTHWSAKEKRVIGEIASAPPVVLSTKPGQYTLGLAVIKFDAGKLDVNNYRGNATNTRQQVHAPGIHGQGLSAPHPTPFKFPVSRLVTLRDQVPESALVNPPMLDPCLVVFKNGAKTHTTIGNEGEQCFLVHGQNSVTDSSDAKEQVQRNIVHDIKR